MSGINKYTEKEATKYNADLWRVVWADGAYFVLKALKRDIGDEAFDMYFNALCKSSPEYKTCFENMKAADEEVTNIKG